ncbi:MAG: lipopolysaccharide biosynthesis protein [Vicinamibacteria bacterium]
MPASFRLRARQSALALVVQVAGVGAGYLVHVALARWMGAAAYGSYAYAMAWTALLAIATALGLPVSGVRFVSEYRATARPALLRGTVRRFRQTVLAAGSLVAIVGTAVALASSRAPAWLVVAAWLVPLSSLVNLNAELARGLGRPQLSQVPDKVLRPLASFAVAAAFYAANGTLSIGQAILAGVVAAGAVALLQFALLARVLSPLVAGARPEYRTREWMQVALPLVAVSLLVLLLGQIDLLVAGLFLEPAQVGIYSAAIRVASLIGFVPLAVTIVTSPQIAALHARGDTPGLQELAAQIVHLSFWPSLALAAVVWALADPILALFGPEFVAGRAALLTLAACQLFKAGMGAVGYFLDMTGHQAYNARAFAVTTILGTALSFAAIPRFGILGAATANLVSWIVVMLWLHHEVATRVGVRASIVSALRMPRRPHTGA